MVVESIFLFFCCVTIIIGVHSATLLDAVKCICMLSVLIEVYSSFRSPKVRTYVCRRNQLVPNKKVNHTEPHDVHN